MNLEFDFTKIRSEIRFSAVRSRGPGGQNVNKVSSAAILYWDFWTSSHLNDEQKKIILEKLDSFINSEKLVFIRSDEFRDLERNKTRCLEKLGELLKKALHKPKKRKPTRPTKSSQIRKKESKTRRSELKRSRQGSGWES